MLSRAGYASWGLSFFNLIGLVSVAIHLRCQTQVRQLSVTGTSMCAQNRLLQWLAQPAELIQCVSKGQGFGPHRKTTKK